MERDLPKNTTLNFHTNTHYLTLDYEGDVPKVLVGSNLTGRFVGSMELDSAMEILAHGAYHRGFRTTEEKSNDTLPDLEEGNHYDEISFSGLDEQEIRECLIQLLVSEGKHYEENSEDCSPENRYFPSVLEMLYREYKSERKPFAGVRRRISRRSLTPEQRKDLEDSDSHRFRFFIEEKLRAMQGDAFNFIITGMIADRLGIYEERERGSRKKDIDGSFEYEFQSQAISRDRIKVREYPDGRIEFRSRFRQFDVVDMSISGKGNHIVQGTKPKLLPCVEVEAILDSDLGRFMSDARFVRQDGLPISFSFNGSQLSLSALSERPVRYFIRFPQYDQLREKKDRTGHKIEFVDDPHIGTLRFEGINDPDISICIHGLEGDLIDINVRSQITHGTLTGKRISR